MEFRQLMTFEGFELQEYNDPISVTDFNCTFLTSKFDRLSDKIISAGVNKTQTRIIWQKKS